MAKRALNGPLEAVRMGAMMTKRTRGRRGRRRGGEQELAGRSFYSVFINFINSQCWTESDGRRVGYGPEPTPTSHRKVDFRKRGLSPTDSPLNASRRQSSGMEVHPAPISILHEEGPPPPPPARREIPMELDDLDAMIEEAEQEEESYPQEEDEGEDDLYAVEKDKVRVGATGGGGKELNHSRAPGASGSGSRSRSESNNNALDRVGGVAKLALDGLGVGKGKSSFVLEEEENFGCDAEDDDAMMEGTRLSPLSGVERNFFGELILFFE